MRRAIAVALASLAAGCAQGSTTDDLEDPVVVALAAPRSPAPAIETNGPGDLSAAERARAPRGSDFATTMPFALVSCKKNAFCDDFEDATPGWRWTGSVATGGEVDFIGPSSSIGANALHVSTTGGSGSAAYLKLAGSALGKQWVGALAFSMRFDAVPTAVFGGPEIAIVDANGATTRIGFSVRPEGIALHQYVGGCTGTSCSSRSDLVTDAKAGEWRRLVVAVETSNTLAPPYGRVEVTVDSGELITLPLMVSPFDGTAEVHAGITVADAAPTTARIDDVVFFTR
jgi:hypothetical protein